MRKFFIIFSFLICNQVESYATLYPQTNKPEIILLSGPNSTFSIDEFLKLKPSGIKRLTGKKMSLKEILALKFTQAKIKTSIRKSRTIDTFVFHNKEKKPFKWHWGGFFLGLFLPFGLGIIISTLNKNERRSDRVTSAAIATAVTCLVIVIIYISAWSGNIY